MAPATKAQISTFHLGDIRMTMNKVMANKAKTAKAAVKKLPKEVSVEAAAEAKLVAENGDHAQGGFSTNVVASDDNSGGSSGGSGISPVVILGGLAAAGGIAAAAAGGGGEKTIVQPVPTPVPAPTPAPVPAPTYAVAADKAAADEGTAIRFTISGTNAAGKVVSYQLTGSAATAADVSSPLTGTVTLDSNGKAYVDVVVSADKLTEGAEKLNLVLSGGEKVAADVTVNDTSLTPAPTAQTFTLTTGKDVFTGGDGADTFTSDAVDPATGSAASTMTSTDVLNGGAGEDTLNITASASNNASIVGTFSNIELVNIDNTAATVAASTGTDALSAAVFVGATNITQIAKATNVTGLAATTTATLKGVTLSGDFDSSTLGTQNLKVSAASTAASAKVSLSGVKGGAAVSGVETSSLDVAGASLNAVTVDGTLKANVTTSKTVLALNVAVGSDALGNGLTNLSVNTALKTVLTYTGAAVTTLDTSAGAGAVTFDGSSYTGLGTILAGAGADTLTIATATVKDNANTAKDETLSAKLDAGAGNDSITVNTSGAGKTTISGGDGNDTITVTGISTGGTSIDAGAGDDIVKLGALGSLVTGTTITGGAGKDYMTTSVATLSLADATALKSYVSGFEGIAFTGAVTSLDVSLLSSDVAYIEFDDTAASVTKVGNQVLEVAGSSLAATANGYDASGATTVYAGTLRVDAYASNTSTLKAQAAVVNTIASNTNGTSDTTLTTTFAGDLKAITASLNSTAMTSATTGLKTGADALAKVVVDLDDGTNLTLNALTNVTVTGAGVVVIDASEGAAVGTVSGKLTSIDLSGMTSWTNLNNAGDQVTGSANNDTTYGYKNLSTSLVTLNDLVSETVKLGGGDDTVVTNSTYAKMDTIEGFQLVATVASSTTVDAAKSDALDISGLVGIVQGIKAVTIAAGTADLDAALLQVAGASNSTGVIDNAVFTFGGNTYFYQDINSDGLTSNDVLVKFTGELNLALLAQTIA